MKNEIKCVMHYLYLKGYSAKAAMNEIHETYNTEYPSYSSAKRMFQYFEEPENEQKDYDMIDSPKKMERISAIQSILDNNSNASVRLIADQTQIPPTSVWRTLVSEMGLIFKNPILAPHDLTSEMKENRVRKCYELLSVLEDPKLKPHKIITGDESWIEWTGRVIGKWQKEDDPPVFSTRLQQTIKKTMIIVFFSFSEIHIIDFLPNGVCNNSEYMCEHIWPVIDQNLRKQRPKKGAHGIFLHFDNSPIHKSKVSLKKIKDLGFILLEHPPYSPDIAPSDFWLFGFIDEKRKGTVVSNENELIEQTSKILSQIDITVLGTVFKEWIRRLHIVIESGGEYLLD